MNISTENIFLALYIVFFVLLFLSFLFLVLDETKLFVTKYKKIILIFTGISIIGLLATLISSRIVNGKDESNILEQPVGEMTLIRGPYKLFNGLLNTALGGHINKNKYKQNDLYGKYGYRAVLIEKDKVVKVSKITWNEKLYKLYDTAEPEHSGLTFKLPDQNYDQNVYYELIGTFYDNPEEIGSSIYTEIPLGRVTSTNLLLAESSDPKVNLNLVGV